MWGGGDTQPQRLKKFFELYALKRWCGHKNLLIISSSLALVLVLELVLALALELVLELELGVVGI